MQVILEQCHLPAQGAVKLNMQREFVIQVTAEEAQRKVSRWLWDEVSMLISADPPTLVIGEQVVWRVPTWIGFPSQGRAGNVGVVDVDVQTGELYDLAAARKKIEACATTIAQKLPPFQPRPVPQEWLVEHTLFTPVHENAQEKSK